MSHLSVRNVNKRIKRRDNKIEDLQLQVEALEQEIDEQSKLIKHFEKESHMSGTDLGFIKGGGAKSRY